MGAKTMSVNPINVFRVSHNMRTNLVVDSVRRTQADLFSAQTRIASGRNFVTPSDDPAAATTALDLSQALARQEQFMVNLRYGDGILATADDAIVEINSLLIEASTIASQTVSNLTSAEERLAEAELVSAIRRQLQLIGNRELNGQFIFAGREITERPFIEALGGIAYVGDTGDLVTRIDHGMNVVINVPGNLLFGALSGRIATDVDLSPQLIPDTRLDALGGAMGEGVGLGTLVFNEVGGAGVFVVDLTSADTIGDVAALINSAATEAGAALTASLSSDGLLVTPGGRSVAVTDQSAGRVARDLGILSVELSTDPIGGTDLGARLTRLTPVEALAGGAGIDLASGLVITNGPRTVTLDLSTAETVQDIINAINNAGVFVLARINEDGTRIDVFNQVSGTALAIGENGGTTAADLGIRTYDAGTPLDALNFGTGVTRREGEADLRITAKNGSTLEVNLDGAVTVGDVIEAINLAATEAGVNVSASLAQTGNGIGIIDNTGGAGDLTVTGINLSEAAEDLGLVGQTTGPQTELVGEDRNPTRTEGVLSALVELENALRADDTQAITLAAERVASFSSDVNRIHGVVGARSRAMQTNLQLREQTADTTQVFLSEVQDLDYADAVTRLQAMTTQLQANLQTSSRVLSLSLLDFLG